MMHFTSVDLPAPFSPSSAWKEPAGTLIETSSNATSGPKIFRIEMVSSPIAREGEGTGAKTALIGRTPLERCRRTGRCEPESSRQPLDQGRRIRHRAEHAALHLHHLDRRKVVAV